MLKNLYTTSMSPDKKKLQNRFSKIRSKNGRLSKLMALSMSALVAATMVCATVGMAAFDSMERYEVTVFYNHEAMVFEHSPFFYDRTVYLPLRELFEQLGMAQRSEIQWYNGSIQIKIDGHQSHYGIHIGQNKIVYDNFWNNTQSDVLTPASPVLMDGVAYIPFEYVEWIINRYNDSYDVSYIYGDIDSKTPYLENAEMKTYVYLCDLQYQVDCGHFPWRLDAQQVIKAFFASLGMENGNITAYEEDGIKCSATYAVDKTAYIVELFKPIQTDKQGIWVVKAYEEK